MTFCSHLINWMDFRTCRNAAYSSKTTRMKQNKALFLNCRQLHFPEAKSKFQIKKGNNYICDFSPPPWAVLTTGNGLVAQFYLPYRKTRQIFGKLYAIFSPFVISGIRFCLAASFHLDLHSQLSFQFHFSLILGFKIRHIFARQVSSLLVLLWVLPAHT